MRGVEPEAKLGLSHLCFYSAVNLTQKQGKPGINLIVRKPYIFEMLILYSLTPIKVLDIIWRTTPFYRQKFKMAANFSVSLNNLKMTNKSRNMSIKTKLKHHFTPTHQFSRETVGKQKSNVGLKFGS